MNQDIHSLLEQERYQELIQQLQGTSDADELKVLATAYQRNKQYEAAMESWSLLIQRLPEVAEFYVERGVCKFNLRFSRTLDDFDKALELEPDNAYYYSCRAYVRDKTGDTEGAVEDYRKAHELEPEDAITLNNLGLAEQKLGYTASAREFFRKSNDLLGIETADAREPEPLPKPPSYKERWKEVRKMLSSWKGFREFLKDLFGN